MMEKHVFLLSIAVILLSIAAVFVGIDSIRTNRTLLSRMAEVDSSPGILKIVEPEIFDEKWKSLHPDEAEPDYAIIPYNKVGKEIGEYFTTIPSTFDGPLNVLYFIQWLYDHELGIVKIKEKK